MAGDYLSSGAVHFTGLGNGTDFNAIIEAMVQAESIHKARLELWRKDWEDKNVAFQELNTTMLGLKTHMQTMDTMDEFFVKQVSSSNSTAVTATADSDASTGTHSVVVTQIAKTEIETNLTTGFSAKTDSVTAGAAVLEFDYGTAAPQTFTLNVGAGTTLEGLVNQINKDASNPGIRASVVYNGSNYYLQVRGMDLGSDNTIAITGNTTLGGFLTADWTNSQTAQNAQFTVDGLAVDTATNTVADVVEGVTFTVKDPGNATITVSNDNDAITENVKSFVDKVNEVRMNIITLTKFDDRTQQGSLLTGNYGLQIISSQLKEVTAQKGVGFDYDDDVISTLSQLGIKTDAEEGSATRGLLIFDEAEFKEKLEADPDAVASLFGEYYKGETNSPDFLYGSHITGMTEAGTYEVEYTTDAGGNITSATIGGYTASVSGTSITGPADTPVAGLSLTAVNLTPSSTINGEVRLKLGKAGEMVEKLEELTSSVDGPLHILQDNYQDIIDNINKKISYEEDRIARTETTLRLRFARLEATLARYEQMKTSLENQVKGLKTS